MAAQNPTAANPFLAELVNKPGLISSRLNAAQIETLCQIAYAHDRERLAFGFGQQERTVSKPYSFNSGIATIPVTGLLMNRLAYVSPWASGYGAIQQMYQQALADPDVKGIVLDCNSPGGMVQGCFELSDFLYEARDQKPSVAVVDANAMSACYAIASAAGRIVAIPSAGVGSIGVLCMHADMSEALDDMGVKITLIYAGKHKVDGNPYEPLSKEVKASKQAEINQLYDNFVSKVARNRGLDEQAVRDTEADTFNTEDALKLGLIDDVAPSAKAFSSFRDSTSSIQMNGDDPMTTAATSNGGAAPAAAAPAATPAVAAAPAVDAAQVAAEARAAERTRITGIVGHAEAKDRGDFAAYLAHNTDMSVEEAGKILAASPKQTVAAVAAPAAAAAGTTAFRAAMDNSAHPNVGAGGGSDTGAAMSAEEQRQANIGRISGAFNKASGHKPSTKTN